jgi:hypothetical protein
MAPAELHKLAAILARLASDHDGEVLAAARAAVRLVATYDLTWTELLHSEAPVPVAAAAPAGPRYWRHTAEECLFDHEQALNDWQTSFLQDILRRGRALSPKQEAALRRIAGRTGVPGW